MSGDHGMTLSHLVIPGITLKGIQPYGSIEPSRVTYCGQQLGLPGWSPAAGRGWSEEGGGRMEGGGGN